MPFAFDDRQLLAPGVHEATLDEIERCFAQFLRSDRRIRLFETLKRFLNDLKQAIPGNSVILDCSFVMSIVDEPGDIDLIVIVPPEFDLRVEMQPVQYNLISKRRVRQEYRFDAIAVNRGSVGEQDWITFFSRVEVDWQIKFDWPANISKGLVKVQT